MSTLTEPVPWFVGSWLPGSLGASDLARLLGSVDLGFAPELLRVKVLGAETTEEPWDASAWQRVAGLEDVTSVEAAAAGGEPTLMATFGRAATEVVLSGVPPTAELLGALLGAPGLLAATAGDRTDAWWQSEDNPQHHRMWAGGDWEQLPRTTDDLGREVVDVSGNAGRISTLAPGVRLWPGHDLWFGPASALLVRYDALGSLPVGEVDDRGQGVLHVALFPEGTPPTEVRDRQQALRDHLGYDVTADREDEIWDALTAGQPADPFLVQQEGEFPHGGSRRVAQYFSAERRPTTRSRAAWVVVQEFRDAGEAVHEEVVDLASDPHPDLGLDG